MSANPASPEPRSVDGYRFGSAVLRVEADEPQMARWLSQFLTPWFEPGVPDEKSVCVRLTCSSAAFAKLDERCAAAGCRPVPCFALDSKVLSLPGWNENGDTTIVADRERGCFYCVRQGGVEIVARPGVLRARVGLLRVVREIAVAGMRGRRGVVDLHAAAVAVGEGAVLLAGPKGSGKTTLLSFVLASGQGHLLANDRVLLDTAATPVLAFGVPTLISVREDTLKLFPALRHGDHERPALLLDAETWPAVPLAEDADMPNFALSPAQFAQRLGAVPRGRAPLAAVVFLEISAALEAFAVDPVLSIDGAARLRECLYGMSASRHGRTIFEDLLEVAGADGSQQIAAIDTLAAQTPLFRCRLGKNAYVGNARAWLEALSLPPACGTASA